MVLTAPVDRMIQSHQPARRTATFTGWTWAWVRRRRSAATNANELPRPVATEWQWPPEERPQCDYGGAADHGEDALKARSRVPQTGSAGAEKLGVVADDAPSSGQPTCQAKARWQSEDDGQDDGRATALRGQRTVA
jgi:hypothetical protein